jgi:hypothetical protein
MPGATDDVDLVAAKEVATHKEARDIAALAIPGIPITGDLRGIFLEEHGIEDGLDRQARRKRGKVALADQRQLFLADGPVEHGRLALPCLIHLASPDVRGIKNATRTLSPGRRHIQLASIFPLSLTNAALAALTLRDDHPINGTGERGVVFQNFRYEPRP